MMDDRWSSKGFKVEQSRECVGEMLKLKLTNRI
jgi:hypothetical protein